MAGPVAWTRKSAVRSRLPFAVVSLLLHAFMLMAGMAFRAPLIDAAGTSLEVVLLHEELKAPRLVPAVVAERDASGGGIEPEERPEVSTMRVRSGRELGAGVGSAGTAAVSAATTEGASTAKGDAARAAPGASTAGDDTFPGTGDASPSTAPALLRRLTSATTEAPGIDVPSAAAARPKRLTYGIDAVGASYARYVRDWTARIEQLGTAHYPPEARGRLYDSLIITVEIDRHGEVVDIVINRPSQHEALNRAVRRLVLAGAPYPPFPPEMAGEGDILRIVRTWTFTNGTLEAAGASRT